MRVAIVGFGAQAVENLVPCCHSIPGVQIVAVSDTNPARLQLARDSYGIGATFLDFREMMENSPIDAIIAASSPDVHYEVALEAMARGIAVFIEKPPAPSTQHLQRLIDAAASSGTTTGVGMNFRFAEVPQRLHRLSNGKVDALTLRHFANKPVQPLWGFESTFRSFLYGQTIHTLDLMLYLCGALSGISVSGTADISDILFSALLVFENGAHATIITGNMCPHFIFDFDAVFDRNVIFSSDSLWNIRVVKNGKPYFENERKKWSDSWSPSPLASGFQRSGYYDQLRLFFEAVQAGGEFSASFGSVLATYQCLDLIEAAIPQQGIIERKKAS